MFSFARGRMSALAEGLLVSVLLAMLTSLAGLTPFTMAAPGSSPSPSASAAAMNIAPGAGASGLSVTVAGSAFPHRVAIQLTWDGDQTGLPAVITSRSGDFQVAIVVPAAAAGAHAVIAMTSVKSSKNGSTSGGSKLAEASFTVSAVASPAPTPTPSPTQTPTPTPGASPTPNPTPTPTPPGGPAISGTVYEDTDRDGVHDAAEVAMSGQAIELRDATGHLLGTQLTDSDGGYAFPGIAAATYQVRFADAAWRALRLDWVPTTTGSLYPRFIAQVQGATVLDFGWRPMVRSTDLFAPIATFIGPSGLRVETYNDAVPPEEVYREVMLGQVGPEAQYVTVRFDFNQSAQTAAGWQGTPGTYSNYAAVIYAGYDFWLDGGDQGISHEYGHAWSYYYDRIFQQESGFARYLAARGLTGDARIGTTYQWYPTEMIAEDYRELFGSDNAKLAWQMNRDIPAPDDVPGLRSWFLNTFMVAPPG